MKILVAQLNPTIGAVSQNVEAMLSAIARAKSQRVQMVIFPEMALSGYPPKDLLCCPEFVETCLKGNEALIEASNDSLLIVWGNVARNLSGIGKPLYNAGYCAWGGRLIAQAYKAHLPTYDIFDEARYFEPGLPSQAMPIFSCFEKQMALTVCEDLWSYNSLMPEEKALITPIRYGTTPLISLQSSGVDYLLNISASPYVQGKPAIRNRLLKRIAASQQSTVIYANQVGANDDLIFDGYSSITVPHGPQWIAPGFQESLEAISIEPIAPFEPEAGLAPEDELIAALVLGIRDYARKTGFKRVLVGLSGGIDSSLTAVLAVKALGGEHVAGVAMPGPYSSSHSLEDAQALADNLGMGLRTLPIHEPFQAYLNLLSQGKRLEDLAEQNLQARLRGTMLMTLANRENALVLATGNKSEIATGYSTLYGDSCGALAPLGDLFKTQVYQLSAWLNATTEWPLIPERVLEKPPSAELAPSQLDSDLLPPYEILDKILKEMIEEQRGFYDLLHLGYDKTYLLQTFQRVRASEYKRQQMPFPLKVSQKAFGSGWIFPVVQQVQLPAVLETTPT